MTLTNFIELLEDVSETSDVYKYCKTIADHVKKVAHPSVRNVGTIGGNLMLKHANQDFPSDLFLLLETADATLEIKSSDNSKEVVSPLQFLGLNMNKKFILKINLPQTTDLLFTYKTMQRAINTHAYVNGGLRLKLDGNFYVLEKPTLVFGGVSAQFVHAVNTEGFLVGRNLKDLDTLKAALESLKAEAVPDNNPVMASPEYRSHLVQALYYRVSLRNVL